MAVKSARYCDVILRRIMNLTGETAMLAETRETFAAAAESRGVPVDQALNPKRQDSRPSSITARTRSTAAKRLPDLSL